MKFKKLFNQQKAIRFRQFSRKGYALFACLGRVVTIGVLSVATLRSAAATSDSLSVVGVSSAKGAEVVGDTLVDKEATLADVEVTGSRAPLALGQAVRMVTVLSREEIQAAPVHSINDLLKMAVGIDVRQRGPMGAQTDIGIRGSTQEQIAVLLNGINICDPQTGHNTFDLPCDLSDIVRIEVLEGPAGRVFGTSSLQGAINIVTSLPPAHSTKRRSKTEVRLEGGSFGYLSAAGSINFSPLFGGVGGSLSASYTRSDGYQRSEAGALNSDLAGAKAFYQGGYHTDNIRLSWHAGVTAKGFGSNTFWSAKYDEQYEKTTKLYSAVHGDLRSGALHFRPAVYWNRSYDRFELMRGSEEKVPYNHHRTDVFGINMNSWFDWLPADETAHDFQMRTALGAEFRNEDIVSTNLGEPLNEPFNKYKVGLNRSNLSFHLEHNIILRRFTLSAGFIAAKNTWAEMPFTLYPGVDASVRLADGLKLYASYNSSLRMPSFTELYYSVGGHQADKHLKPEELRAVEGGVKYEHLSGAGQSICGIKAVRLQAAIFHHHARNMIDWVMDTREADPIWKSVNHTRINTLGEEATANLQFSRFNFQLNYCHLHQQKQQAEDYLQSQYSLEYLRHKFTARLQMPLAKRLSLSVGYRWQDRMGKYTDTAGDVQDYHPYSIVDARLSWTSDTYYIYIDGNNLTNYRYVDYGNVLQPGCWVKVGATINW